MGLLRIRVPCKARNRKKITQIIFNNPRSSIKLGSAPDPKLYYNVTINIPGNQIMYFDKSFQKDIDSVFHPCKNKNKLLHYSKPTEP